jgi:hypothetical protein
MAQAPSAKQRLRRRQPLARSRPSRAAVELAALGCSGAGTRE